MDFNTISLDQADYRILRELVRDGRIADVTLGERVHLSSTAVGRRRKIMESQLDDIEGVGTRRKEDLLRHFGSIARLRRATVEQIAAAPGVGPELAQMIHRMLAQTTPEPAEDLTAEI